MQLSLDGVQECRSNSVSLDVYTLKFVNCKNIYPLKIIRPVNKFHVDYKPQFKAVLDSLKACACELDSLVADNPKRSELKDVLCHSSNFACEYCTSKAVQYKETCVTSNEEKKKNELKIKQIEKEIKSIQQAIQDIPCSTSHLKKQEAQIGLLHDLIKELKRKIADLNKKKSHPVWPESTSNGQPRSKEQILEIVQAIEDQGRAQLSADYLQGIIGRSLLLDIDDFDFIKSVPAEYMHLGCLGVVKRLTFVMFMMIKKITIKNTQNLSFKMRSACV